MTIAFSVDDPVLKAMIVECRFHSRNAVGERLDVKIKICVWLVLTLAYLLLAGQVSMIEIATAVIGGCLGAAWLRAVLRASPRSVYFAPSDGKILVRAIADLPFATIKVAMAFADASSIAGSKGSRSRRFVRGRRADPRAAGRRAIAVLAASLAPDSFVLRLPEHCDEIELHALVDATSRGDER